MSNTKQRVVNVNTPNGLRKLSFVVEQRVKGGLTCEYCQYYGICEKLPHPETPDDQSVSFTDFCTFCINMEDADGKTWIPAPGTIEENLADVLDPYKHLATQKDNLYVPLKRVIDVACNGICADYNEEHSNCTCQNKFCLLKELFHRELDPDSGETTGKEPEGKKEDSEAESEVGGLNGVGAMAGGN